MTLQSPSYQEHQHDDDQESWDDENSWDEHQQEQPRVIYPDEIDPEEGRRTPARGSRYNPKEEPADPSHSNDRIGSEDDDDDPWGDEEDHAHISLRPSSISPSSLLSPETTNRTLGEDDWEASDGSDGGSYGRHQQTPGEIDASESGRGGRDYSHSSSNNLEPYATRRQSRAPPEPLQAPAAAQRRDYDNDNDSFDEEFDNSNGGDGYGGYHRDSHTVPTNDDDDDHSFSSQSSGGFDQMVNNVLDDSDPRTFDEEVQRERQSHYQQRSQGGASNGNSSAMGWSDEDLQEDAGQVVQKRSTRPEARASEFHNPQAVNSSSSANDNRRAALAKAKALSQVYLYMGVLCIVLGLACAIAAIALKDKGRS